MQRHTVRTSVLSIGALLLAANFSLPVAQGAVLGGSSAWRVDRTRNINHNWSMFRGNTALWKWTAARTSPTLQLSPNVTPQPVSRYYFIANGRTLAADRSCSTQQILGCLLAFQALSALPPISAIDYVDTNGGAVTTFAYTGSGSVTVAAVPEPTGVGLLLCAGGWLLKRRRR